MLIKNKRLYLYQQKQTTMKNYIAIYTTNDGGNKIGQLIGYNTKSPSPAKGMNKEQFEAYVKTKTCFSFKIEEIK